MPIAHLHILENLLSTPAAGPASPGILAVRAKPAE